jgi:uncharacterized protein YqjF (DUF2071 family)
MEAASLRTALTGAGVDERTSAGCLEALRLGGLLKEHAGILQLTPAGVVALLDAYTSLSAALDPSPSSAIQENCPTVPWLTAVQTAWIDALSINYAVEPKALANLLPAPLEPEIHKGTGWVQVLMSSLRDMRPHGLPSVFGVCFYQVAYRAAVRYRSADGQWKRGGYFVRSETNHPVMRSVGNALTEFKFHDFGAADMVMLRQGDRLTIGVDPQTDRPGGKLVGIFDTGALPRAPQSSVWKSIDDLHEPLVECFDALGVDRAAGFLYVLTIDRDPWRPHFCSAEQLYCEYVDKGALAGAARLDSILHFSECRYRWRPLRREPLA